ncbi:MAG: hypothetical protein BGO77_06650 [Caedibacter sp. 37-49]|nr:MAG: hypothetical protein BGO77_06650 [Caedibacter sp. 37-49]
MKIITFLMTVATITTVSGVLNSGLAMEGQGSSHSSSKKVDRDESGAPKKFVTGNVGWMLWSSSTGDQRTYYETEGREGRGRNEERKSYHFTIESPSNTIQRIADGYGAFITFHTTTGKRHIRWTYNIINDTISQQPAKPDDHVYAGMSKKAFDQWLQEPASARQPNYHRDEALKFIRGWVAATRQVASKRK